jgi:hypothetical protein
VVDLCKAATRKQNISLSGPLHTLCRQQTATQCPCNSSTSGGLCLGLCRAATICRAQTTSRHVRAHCHCHHPPPLPPPQPRASPPAASSAGHPLALALSGHPPEPVTQCADQCSTDQCRLRGPCREDILRHLRVLCSLPHAAEASQRPINHSTTSGALQLGAVLQKPDGGAVKHSSRITWCFCAFPQFLASRQAPPPPHPTPTLLSFSLPPYLTAAYLCKASAATSDEPRHKKAASTPPLSYLAQLLFVAAQPLPLRGQPPHITLQALQLALQLRGKAGGGLLSPVSKGR